MEAPAHHLELVNVLRDGEENYVMKVLTISHFVYPLQLEFTVLIITAICDPSCENNGSCLAPNHCSCQQGYSGDRCERSNLLHNICINDGLILLLHCMPVLCSPACQNGNCTPNGTCECDEGWTGEQCDEGKLQLCCQLYL